MVCICLGAYDQVHARGFMSRQLLGSSQESAQCELAERLSERLVALRWDEQVEGEYSVELRIEVETRRGMIAVIATRINSMGVNIEKISTEDKDYQFTYVDMEMPVRNRVHLAHIMKRLRAINSVRKVTRIKN